MDELYYLVGQEYVYVHGFESIDELLSYFDDELQPNDEGKIVIDVVKYKLSSYVIHYVKVEHDSLSDSYDYEIIEEVKA